MRLIQCHIENFGKLRDVTIDFKEGLNAFSKQNGWGKSTLGAFLRVMLYGFEGENKRSNPVENERKRYEPWQGGVYGGSITFAFGDKEYIVTRIFKDKAANDIFELRDAKTNLESRDFSENLGEEIFKINSEAFMKTSFIKQQDCQSGTNDSINAKIGNLTDSTNDINNFETADAALKDVLNKMSPRVKKGMIHQMNEEITRLKQEVSDGKALDASMETLRRYYDEAITELEGLKEKKVRVSKEQEIVSRYQDVLAKKESYDLLCKQEAEKEAGLKESLAKFPNGVPNEAEVKDALELCSRLERILSAERVGRLSDAQQKEYDFLSGVFAKGLPEEGALYSKLETAKQMDAVQRKYEDNRMTSEEEEKYFEEKAFFGCECPSEEINRLQQKWSERSILKGTISVQQASIDGEKRRQAAELALAKKQGNQKKLLGATGIILGLVSGVVFVVMNLLPILAVSAVLVIAGVILLVTSGKMPTMEDASDHTMEEEFYGNKQRIEETEREAELYFTRHNLAYSEERVMTQLQKLLSRALTFESLVEKHKKYSINTAESSGEQKAELDGFLKSYSVIFGDCINYADKVNRLRQKAEQYSVLKEMAEANKEHRTQLLEVRHQLSGFLQTYGLAGTDEELLRNLLQHMLADVKVHKTLVDEHALAAQQKEAFKSQNNIEEILNSYAETEPTSLQQLQEEFVRIDEETEDLRSQIKTYEDQLSQLQEKHDEWMATKELLEEKEAEVKKQKEKYALLEKTREFLGKAKEELTLRYTGPIMEHFAHYYAIVTGQQPDAYKMDANIHLTVNEQGLQRDTIFLSTGYQDLIGVCLRIALVEAMYTSEKPMLVLDDPFVNFDEEKTIGSRRLLDELSKHYQVLYFTCK